MPLSSEQDRLKQGPLRADSVAAERGRRGLGHVFSRSFGAGAVVIAVLVGIQLGTIPWRYRRQIWQLQGFLLGGLAGYVAGRLGRSRGASGADDPGDRHPPSLPPPS